MPGMTPVVRQDLVDPGSLETRPSCHEVSTEQLHGPHAGLSVGGRGAQVKPIDHGFVRVEPLLAMVQIVQSDAGARRPDRRCRAGRR
jgi:hypothetical protein